MSMARINYLMTYGTLMSTSTTFLGRAERTMMQQNARLLGVVSVPGRLYCVGACPAAVTIDGRRNRRDRVFGELWAMDSDARRLLEALDRYEGCAVDSPRPHLYARRRVRVVAPDGRRVTAWYYQWDQGTAALVPIAGGRWHAPRDGGLRANVCTEAIASAV